MSGTQRHFVPSFISVQPGLSAGEYVVSNDATGTYFQIDAAVSRFLDALRGSESLAYAARVAGLSKAQLGTIVDKMKRAGVIVERGATVAQAAKTGPIESRAVSVRVDLFNGAGVMRRLSWVGQFAFSWAGLALWLGTMIVMVTLVTANPDKAWYSLTQIRSYGIADIAAFTFVYVALKIAHESGHAMAYRIMCLREGLEPGPIRMGISIFAMTPFAFTDVTGAWRIKSRWRRAAIGAGGLYFELFAIALMTMFWANTTPDLLQNAMFQAGTFSAVTSVLFNLNPLIKLDGYYVMSDLRGQYNLAPRASRAAMATFARFFGATLARPPRADLAYWGASYLYRWSLFSGIFFVAWVFDQRFAVLVGGVVIMMLIVRPLMGSVKFARSQQLRPVRAIAAMLGFAALIGLLLVPLPNRLLIDGRLSAYDTRYLYATERGRLELTETGLQINSPELTQELLRAQLQIKGLENAARSVAPSGGVQARLQADLSQAQAIYAQLAERAAATDMVLPPTSEWVPMGSRTLQGQVMGASAMAEPLGAVSSPSDLVMRLWLPQDRLEAEAVEQGVIAVRLRNDPTCGFDATLDPGASGRAAWEGYIPLIARADALPDCAQTAQSGTPIVARLTVAPRSVFSHIVHRIQRLLQNKLPVSQAEPATR